MPKTELPAGLVNVLIADDQEWSSRSWANVFETRGLTVRAAYTGRQCLELARSASPELVVLNQQLPDMDGLEVCRQLRDGPDGAILPIVLTTAASAGRADRLAAYEAGAWEFCTHPVDTESLLVKIGTFLRCRRTLEQMRGSPSIDSGTGLYSASGLAMRARELAADATRHKRTLACVTLSLDSSESTPAGSRWLDDSGHANELLGKVCRGSARASDIVGRLGDTEVAILAADTDGAGIRRLVDRIQKALDRSLNALGSSTAGPSVRAGFSTVEDAAAAGIDPVDLLRRASTALRSGLRGARAQSVTAFEDIGPDRLPGEPQPS